MSEAHILRAFSAAAKTEEGEPFYNISHALIDREDALDRLNGKSCFVYYGGGVLILHDTEDGNSYILADGVVKQ
jgi:hypothetical protein